MTLNNRFSQILIYSHYVSYNVVLWISRRSFFVIWPRIHS